jgi:integrase
MAKTAVSDKLKEYLVNSDESTKKFLILASYTGLRIGEIMPITYEDVVGKEVVQVSLQKKRGKTVKRRVVLPRVVQEFFADYQDYKGYIFRGRDPRKPMTIRAMQYRLAKLSDDGLSGHSFRKMFGRAVYERATENSNQSDAIVFLMKIFGHSNPATTLRYIGVLNESLIINDLYATDFFR